MQNINKTLKSYKQELEAKGYKVLYLGLYGSQNYNLADENSDIDVKVIVALSLDDLINRRVISEVVDLSNGQANIQDILTFNDTIRKGNPVCLEAIYSKYWIGDKNIKKFFKQFKLNYRAVVGMAVQKYEALTHPYPSKLNEIEKWGFDPKQLHHIVRLYQLLDYVIKSNKDNLPVCPFLVYSDASAKKMIELKRNSNNLTLNQAQELADKYLKDIKNLVPQDYKFESIQTPKQKKFLTDIIKKELQKELIENNSLQEEKLK